MYLKYEIGVSSRWSRFALPAVQRLITIFFNTVTKTAVLIVAGAGGAVIDTAEVY